MILNSQQQQVIKDKRLKLLNTNVVNMPEDEVSKSETTEHLF